MFADKQHSQVNGAPTFVDAPFRFEVEIHFTINFFPFLTKISLLVGVPSISRPSME